MFFFDAHFIFNTHPILPGQYHRLSQTLHQHSGWLFLMNSTKLSEKWGTHLDVQFRSSDEFDHLRNFLFRPGVTYYVNNKSELTLGYLLNETFNRNAGVRNVITEHRIWQQYIYKHKIGKFSVSHRLRTEQRFIERSQDDLFAMRFRYFIRGIVPLKRVGQTFEKGPFLALQNEAFLHVQNEDAPKMFDQNRAYIAVGYRVGKQLDLEGGYLNQTTTGSSRYTINHGIQIALYTRF